MIPLLIVAAALIGYFASRARAQAAPSEPPAAPPEEGPPAFSEPPSRILPVEPIIVAKPPDRDRDRDEPPPPPPPDAGLLLPPPTLDPIMIDKPEPEPEPIVRPAPTPAPEPAPDPNAPKFSMGQVVCTSSGRKGNIAKNDVEGQYAVVWFEPSRVAGRRSTVGESSLTAC